MSQHNAQGRQGQGLAAATTRADAPMAMTAAIPAVTVPSTEKKRPPNSPCGSVSWASSASARPKNNKPAARDKAAAKTNTRVARNRQERVSAPKQPVSNRRLYVGNLSYEATESDLEDVFKGIGEVNSVEIIYNPRTHKSKGYAFVEMKKMEDAIRSVDILHNQPFMGRNLLVSGANERQEQPRQPREDRAPREEQGSMAEVKETSTPLLQPEAPAPQSQEQ